MSLKEFSLDSLFLSRLMRGLQRKELNCLWNLPQTLRVYQVACRTSCLWAMTRGDPSIRPGSRLSQLCIVLRISVLHIDFNVFSHPSLTFILLDFLSIKLDHPYMIILSSFSIIHIQSLANHNSHKNIKCKSLRVHVQLVLVLYKDPVYTEVFDQKYLDQETRADKLYRVNSHHKNFSEII